MALTEIAKKRQRLFDRCLIAALATIVAFLMFVPPTIGLANNGDFRKMIGRFSMGPADPRNPDERIYYEQRWRFHPEDSWIADTYSSELLPIGLAVTIGQAFDNKYFDIRFLGVIHALLWIGCFAAALPLFRRLRGWPRYLLPAFALLVFSDASYVAHFNSFHTDTLAFLALTWCIAIVLRMAVGDWSGWRPASAFLVFAFLFVTAKPQHSLLGIPLWFCAIYAGTWLRGTTSRTAWVVLTCWMPAGVWLEIHSVPDGERRHELCNSIFVKILPLSKMPADDLQEIGLSPEFARFQGVSAERAYDNPIENPQLRDSLTVGLHRRVAWFCLTHPWRTLRIIYRDLKRPAADRQPPFLGNYQRESGLPPFSRARSFAWWSDLRSLLFRLAPWHIVLWYAAFAGVAGYRVWRPTSATARRVAAVALLLAVQGLLALGFASLGESGETDRHLWMFHVITDLTVLLGITAVCQAVNRASDAR